ncbi:hypothetical protein ACFLQ0_00455 [Nitrospinota bacterium]
MPIKTSKAHRLFMLFGVIALAALMTTAGFSQIYPIVPLQSLDQVVGEWEGSADHFAAGHGSITITISPGGLYVHSRGQKTIKGRARVKNGKLVIFQQGELWATYDFHQGKGAQELSGDTKISASVIVSRNVTASAPPPAPAPSASSAPAAGADGFLTEGGIKSLLVGKTIRYEREGRFLAIHFKENGGIEGTWEGSGRVFRKNWWVKGGKILCRTAGRENRNHCAKVKADGHGKVTFINPKGKFRYTASLLDGRKLP